MAKKRKKKNDSSKNIEEDNLDVLDEEIDSEKKHKKKSKKTSEKKEPKPEKKEEKGKYDGKTKIVGGVERVPTGIKNFDKLIKRGFEKNSTNLLVAGGGGGKSIFGMQFLIEGIKNGENCLYIMFEEKREEFFSNMKEFGWDMEKYEKQGKFTFLEYNPEKIKTILEKGGGTEESIE
jgi:predicted ATP-dependent serine protease